eukprot:gene123-3513_t
MPGPSVGLWLATGITAVGVGLHTYLHYVEGINVLSYLSSKDEKLQATNPDQVDLSLLYKIPHSANDKSDEPSS